MSRPIEGPAECSDSGKISVIACLSLSCFNLLTYLEGVHHDSPHNASILLAKFVVLALRFIGNLRKSWAVSVLYGGANSPENPEVVGEKVLVAIIFQIFSAQVCGMCVVQLPALSHRLRYVRYVDVLYSFKLVELR
jgi:hypothetical protein